MGMFTEFDFANMLPNINRLCQLHERLHVIYIVTEYEASLDVGEGNIDGVSAHGPTVQEALLNLDELLQPYPDVGTYRKAMFERARK